MEAFKTFLVDELDNHIAFTIPLFGGISVAESVVVTWIVMAVWMIARNQKPDLAAAMEQPGFSL